MHFGWIKCTINAEISLPFLCHWSRNVLLPHTFFIAGFKQLIYSYHASHLNLLQIQICHLIVSKFLESIRRWNALIISVLKNGKEISFAISSLNSEGVRSSTWRKGQTTETSYFLQLSFSIVLESAVVAFYKCSMVCFSVSADRHNKCHQKSRNSGEDLEI